MQAHLATARTAWELIEDADLDWQDDERIRFTATNLVDALAPSNIPLLNPLALKAVIDTGGRQRRHRASGGWCRDLATPPRVPSMVEPDAFTVGEDLAVTPGAVVFRTDVFELIQYRPTTETVRAVPLLMVPPTINKFYIADLAPGRSIVEHYLSAGPAGLHDVLAQPRRAARRLGPGRLRPGGPRRDGRRREGHRAGAGRASRRSAPAGSSPRWCWPTSPRPGGRTGWPPASFAVTVLDWARAGTVSALMDEEAVKAADREVAEEGLPGRRPAGRGLRLAAAQRPGLELLGQQLPAGQAAAELRHPLLERRHHPDERGAAPRLHRRRARQRADRARARRRCSAPRSTCPRSPSTPTSPPGSPTTSARGRPATAPPSCSAATSRFILSTSGHIASLVNPPGNPKSTFQVAAIDPGRPAGVAGGGGDGPGLLVAGLHDLAGRALRRGDPGADRARRRRCQVLADGARAPMSSTSSRPARPGREYVRTVTRGRPHAAGGRPARDGRRPYRRCC